MVYLFDVNPKLLAKEVAAALKEKKELTPPNWSRFVKTGAHRERPPVDKDWWHIRAASVLRAICKNGPIGVSKLRVKYGSKRNRGVAPEKFRKGSGAIIRKILQQLESAGLIKQQKESVHKGRVITPAGISLLNKSAVKVKEMK